MTEEKILATLPSTVNVIHYLRTGKADIAHNGAPLEENLLPQCGMSLDWYCEGADLLFKSGADYVSLNFAKNAPGGAVHILKAGYKKVGDIAANSPVSLERCVTYATFERWIVEVDAKLVEAYRQRVAKKEEEK